MGNMPQNPTENGREWAYPSQKAVDKNRNISETIKPIKTKFEDQLQ